MLGAHEFGEPHKPLQIASIGLRGAGWLRVLSFVLAMLDDCFKELLRRRLVQFRDRDGMLISAKNDLMFALA